MTNLPPALPAVAVGSSMLADWTRMLGTLCLLLATVWLALLWLKGRNWFKAALDRRIRLRVDESRGLGNRSFLHLVSCGSQQFLISSSPAGVSMIAELMPEESHSSVTAPQTTDFSQRLKEALPKAPTGRTVVP
jgi:flagellar biogenesis protein FliO